MKGVNKVILVGNVGRDPEIQTIEGGIAVAKFSLATTEFFKDKMGNMVSQTEWHNVVLWRGLAEMAQKTLHKGSSVYVEGKLKTRTWEDRDKIKRFSVDIIGENVILLDKKPESYSSPNEATTTENINTNEV